VGGIRHSGSLVSRWGGVCVVYMVDLALVNGSMLGMNENGQCWGE